MEHVDRAAGNSVVEEEVIPDARHMRGQRRASTEGKDPKRWEEVVYQQNGKEGRVYQGREGADGLKVHLFSSTTARPSNTSIATH